jgi:hypothetical protein
VIYFVLNTVTREIKIGYSKSPKNRLAELKTATSHELVKLGEIPGGLEHEAELHARFAKYRVRGEWFTGEIRGAVQEIIDEHVANAPQLKTNVLVTGNRDFDDRTLVFSTLDGINAQTPVVWALIGGDRREERFAWEWATEHKVPIQPFHTDWKKYGRGTGSEVGKRMLRALFDPKLVLAFFTDRVSPTLRAFVRRAEKEGVEVIRIQIQAAKVWNQGL